ncbi:exopolysaccharide biosynthesis polyprenyl glycosylphosphotransferase [Flavobacterium sp. LT1R49]|uniref:exopolysaccharide biosynthesis polyprenyl glycosylphosphotransferase n=1 Tax=Flavobacterium arabinosi TaxID=3398737 RepID=UPI003A8538C4
MRNRHKFTFIFCCIVADFLAMIIGTLVFLSFSKDDAVDWNVFLLNNMILVAILTWLLPILYFRLYRLDTLFSLDAFYRNSWRALLVQRILWQCYIFIFQGTSQYTLGISANLFQLSFLLFYFLVSRVFFTVLLVQMKKWVKMPFNVAIWGFNSTSIELAAKLETNNYFINFLGIINDNTDVVYQNKKAFSFALSDAIHRASAANVQELYIVSEPKFIIDLNYYFELADNYCMRLKFVPDFSMISKVPFSSSNFNNFHVIKPRNEPLQDAYNRLTKRIFDIIFSLLVVLFVMSWLYPILALIIKRQSKGPVLFKQLRTGKKNESFWCYKFRSMQVNSLSDSHQAQKKDARITPIGQFIRRTSIDELPQFFNVLRGDMSVVGPRPHMLKHTKDYNDQINNFMVRHFVKPGITGLAQVSGLRGETKKVSDMKRRVNADIDYLQNWNLIKDVKICFLTVIVTLKGDENAF